MDLSTKISNTLIRKQKMLEAFTILMILVAIGFRFDAQGSGWFWNDYPFIAIILVMTGLLSALLWIRAERKKTQLIISGIRQAKAQDSNSGRDKIALLTARQKEILELITQGKSNKEIMDALFIEHSTLKTHINQMYKTLQVANRKEAQNLAGK